MRLDVFGFLRRVGIAFCFLGVAANSQGAEQPWRPLFNGRNLDGWYIVIAKARTNDHAGLVQIDDGAIHMYKDAAEASRQPAGYIVTEKDHSNYHLKLEYKWARKRFAPRATIRRDAGILFHVVGQDGVWPRSVECQIQEGDVGDVFTVNTRVTALVDPATTNLAPVVRTNEAGNVVTNQSSPVYLPEDKGGVPFVRGVSKGIQRVIRNPMYEREGWNTVEVIVRGDSATYIVNGKVNNEVRAMEEMIDNKWVPLTKGKIALQFEFAEVSYRNVQIKEL